MGEHDIPADSAHDELRAFMRALLDDVQALERMIDGGRIESGIRRIGAEQEMFLVDGGWQPALSSGSVLERLGDPRFTTELARFNLEANLSPQTLSGHCLSAMERETEELVSRARDAAAADDLRILLCGILPTLEQAHLSLDSMTPNPRYARLNQVMTELRGGEFRTLIKGLDELQLTHDNVMLEACNTSFQVHFQVGAEEFPKLYNLAQAVTAPVLAAAVNSPVLLQHRLWHETRVALFQQSLDARSEAEQHRGKRQRVYFGDGWVKESVLEVFREDIARFRVLLATDLDEPSTSVLERGGTPKLRALCLHNGTVYRWNRPCYGVVDGVAHLRIENRVLPAGPTIRDEMGNAAFYFGLMCALGDEYGDITEVLAFDDVKSNFMAAARYGLSAQFKWVDGRAVSAVELIKELLPVARRGLLARHIDAWDVDLYLGVVRDRVESGRTGAQWALDSLSAMNGRGSPDEQHRALVSAIAERQISGMPVHEWPLAQVDETDDWRHSFRTVGQVMTRDVFTVHPEDVIDLAASLMDWERVRHVPVEDTSGRVVGIISQRALLRIVARGLDRDEPAPVAVREIMKPDPVIISPQMSTLDAIAAMRRHKVGCLPVVEDGHLVGIVTEHDFIDVAAKLLEDSLRSTDGDD